MSEEGAERKMDAFTESLRELMMAIVEQCAKAVEELPASVSLYENSKICEAVIAFKKMAVEEIRSLNSPATHNLGFKPKESE